MKPHQPGFRLKRNAWWGILMLAALGSSPLHAATLTANFAAPDAAKGGDGLCSLREAVLSVNSGANVGDCVANVTEPYGTNDRIILPAGTYTLTLGGADETYTDSAPSDPLVFPVEVITSDATKGDLDLIKSVRIVGAGAATTVIQWDQIVLPNADRIFHVFDAAATTGTVNVSIQGVTLTRGRTFETSIKAGATATQTYYLRRAGGALAVGAAANVVLIDTSVSGADSGGTGGSQRPGETEAAGATYTLSLSNVIIEGNAAQGDGGGFYTAAATTATSVTVRNNTAATNGGGVYNEGNTSFADSTLSGNRAEGGGGLFLTGSNKVAITASTLSANRAIGGGAISARSGVTVNLLNSTLSANLGDDVGAGLYANGPVFAQFVTIANNVSGGDAPTAGAGINTFPSGSVKVTVKDVLLAGNKKGWDPAAEPDGPATTTALLAANCGATGATPSIVSAGNNLSSDTTCTALFTVATDTNNVDPKIGALANNGGPTQTHALLAGSPALSKGATDPNVKTDQRGSRRESPPDIGAFELANIVPKPVAPVSGGGGGCAVGGEWPFDPIFPAMLAIALTVLGLRRRDRTRK